MYGLLFLVGLTSRGPIQTGQGNIRFSVKAAISRTSTFLGRVNFLLSRLNNRADSEKHSGSRGELRKSGERTFRIIPLSSPGLPVKFSGVVGDLSAEMPRRKNSRRSSKVPLDKKTANTRTGRPGVRHSEIVGRAVNYRSIFWCQRLDRKKKEWVRDKPYTWAMALVAAKTTDELRRALESAPSYARNEFNPLISLILKVLQERAFPKKQKAQFDFLADSLAAYGRVSPRRSRDICGEERAKERTKSPYKIIRKEFYVECSCGYKGPALDDACRKCRAAIAISLEESLSSGLL
jgi:hypothetical protein